MPRSARTFEQRSLTERNGLQANENGDPGSWPTQSRIVEERKGIALNSSELLPHQLSDVAVGEEAQLNVDWPELARPMLAPARVARAMKGAGISEALANY